MYYYLALRAILMKQEEGLGGFWGGSVIEYMCDSGTGVLCLQSHTVHINHAVTKTTLFIQLLAQKSTRKNG
jgi:hypothetical protein